MLYVWKLPKSLLPEIALEVLEVPEHTGIKFVKMIYMWLPPDVNVNAELLNFGRLSWNETNFFFLARISFKKGHTMRRVVQ